MSPLDPEKSLISVVDRSVNDKGFRFLVFLAIVAQDGPIQFTFDEIASHMKCSERQAQRMIVKLEQDKKIRVDRNGRKANFYSLYSVRYRAILTPCGQCGRNRSKLSAAGLCDRCGRRAGLKARTARFRRENPGQPLPMQWVGSRMNLMFREIVQELDDEERIAG